MAFKINNKFSMFQFVYIVSDYDQFRRQVVQINILPGQELVYVLSCNGETTEHYESEISEEAAVF
jgi:hypothetical protein